jgi:hypothetical protein
VKSSQLHNGGTMTTKSTESAKLLIEPAEERTAARILRGVQRLLHNLDFASLSEMPLANGRRADVIALSPSNAIWIVEIKSSIADFRTDQKWPDYRDYCDALYFAVTPDFPNEILPTDTGLILADGFGGEVIRPAPEHPLSAPRRKALVTSFALLAARRLHALCDPDRIAWTTMRRVLVPADVTPRHRKDILRRSAGRWLRSQSSEATSEPASPGCAEASAGAY